MLDLQKEVNKILKDEYFGDVKEAVAEVVPKVAKDAAKKLRSASPRKSGKYAKGWTSTVEKGRLTISSTVHGKSGTYQLAHLLENGHAKRGGGRTAPIVHIAPIEEWAVKEVETQIKQRIQSP